MTQRSMRCTSRRQWGRTPTSRGGWRRAASRATWRSRWRGVTGSRRSWQTRSRQLASRCSWRTTGEPTRASTGCAACSTRRGPSVTSPWYFTGRASRRSSPPAVGAGAAAPWRLDAEAAGGGLFVDVGSHVLDLLDFLLGPLQEVCGTARGPPGAVESRVAASFAWPSGAVGSATWDFSAPLGEDVLEIRGTAGALTLPDLMNGDETLLRRAGFETQVFSDPPPPVVQRPLVSTVIDAVRKGDCSLCPSTAASALRTAQAMDAILDSYYNRRDDDFWKRPHTWQTRGPQ
ncbi:unnamed protein product [Prorocentrum cordatum]|uniref:GFO/IDH/MocA-like oxidoreductase domain-containing protein n=1 Tax=Prorocentrum cordatum TaxID=2364126 RepID=A0ABN9SPX8_9DINO|nr:unnamed protein product [Polarella glacialis]